MWAEARHWALVWQSRRLRRRLQRGEVGGSHVEVRRRSEVQVGIE